jgi:soluble lytic murein transglycosylase-like protein/DNA-binding SARP family transcriptional activator
MAGPPLPAAVRKRGLALLAATALLPLGGGSDGGLLGASTAAAVATERPVAAAAEAEFAVLGETFRGGGFAALESRLGPWTAPQAAAGEPERAALARTLLGLAAHAADDPERALELLDGAPVPRTLDDWRLHVLADVAAARGALDRARAALDELLARHPDSPLRGRSIVRLAELAWQAGEATDALDRIGRARAERLPIDDRIALERLAWTIATERRDAAAQREAARRLLVVAPIEASKMKVVDAVAARGGGSDWRLWLSPAELVERAAALEQAGVPAGALTTLAAVPAEARGFEWRRIEARALVASGRPTDAFSVLAAAVGADDGERAALELERARAARAAADGSSTRPLGAEERAHWRRIERERLLAAVRAGGSDAELARKSLGRLAASYLAEGRHDEAVAALRQLAAADPADSSGARPLWERGWEVYRGGDVRRAIAIWSDLEALYPSSVWTRSGRYWTARAHDRLGDRAAARAGYLAVLAAHTSDFYARQAALRLAGAEATTAATPAPAPWPVDARLARARWLSDVGLDHLARTELDLVRGAAPPRAAAALAGLVAAREGARRESLRELKRAFPELGTALQGNAPAEALALYYPLDFRSTVEHAAAGERLPASVVFGMIHQESGFDPAARSHAGARGLMQLMPATGQETARRLGLPYSSARLDDPDYSVRLGTHYFRRMLSMFDGNVELALAAYNGGPGRISRLWRAEGPDAELDRFLEGLSLEESRNYVKRIVVLAESYRSLYPELG